MGDQGENTVELQKQRIEVSNVLLKERLSFLHLSDLYLALEEQITTLTSVDVTFDETIEAELLQFRTTTEEQKKQEAEYYKERREEFYTKFYKEEIDRLSAELEECKRLHKLEVHRLTDRCDSLELQLGYERTERESLVDQRMSVQHIKYKKELAVAKSDSVLVEYEHNLVVLQKLIAGWEGKVATLRGELEVEIEQKYRSKYESQLSQQTKLIAELHEEVSSLKIDLRGGTGSVDALDGPINEYEELLKKIPVVDLHFGKSYERRQAHGSYYKESAHFTAEFEESSEYQETLIREFLRTWNMKKTKKGTADARPQMAKPAEGPTQDQKPEDQRNYRFMSEEDMTLLEMNRPQLMDAIMLEGSTLLSELVNRLAITSHQLNVIQAEPGEQAQIEKLLDILSRGHENTIDILCYSLRSSGQNHVAKQYLRSPRFPEPRDYKEVPTADTVEAEVPDYENTN